MTFDATAPVSTPAPATHQAEQCRLDEELEKDVNAPGTDRHPNADLPRALGDRDEQDVHDADAADESEIEAIAASSSSMTRLLASATSAISVRSRTAKSSGLTGLDPMTPFERLRHLLQRRLDQLRAARLHVHGVHEPRQLGLDAERIGGVKKIVDWLCNRVGAADPRTLSCDVRNGMRTVSSWSCPDAE